MDLAGEAFEADLVECPHAGIHLRNMIDFENDFGHGVTSQCSLLEECGRGRVPSRTVAGQAITW